MNIRLITFLAMAFFLLTSSGLLLGAKGKPFVPNVDPQTGAIQVPDQYRLWPVLGTWSHANPDGPAGAHEYHVVYTQPETIVYYKKHRRFPDGAVLVKELIAAQTMPMTTGPAVSHAVSELKGWFVLVRDTQNRFETNPSWGDGWGWAFFKAGDPLKTVSTDYQEDCVACHLPARQMAPQEAADPDKWIYTLGYPVLQ